MKIKYISIVFFLFTFLSCNDSFMERIPKDQLSDESFWKVEDDVAKYTTSIYRYIPEPGDHSIILDAFTDNAAIVHVSHDQGAISAGTATASNSWFQRVWAELYKGVRRCNVFFENIDDVTMSEDNRNIYKGEVEYMRAFFYATLLKFYGGVPIITHPMELNEQVPPRDPAEDVYKFIISECNNAIAKLPITREETGRATKGAAIALKVHISFLMKDYTETISSVEELNKLNKYDLFPNYKELFTADNENNIEVIFDMQYMDKAKDFKNGSNFDRFFTPGIFGGWEACSPSQNIVDEFECIDGEPISSSPLYNEENPYVNRDLRLDATILRHGSKFAEGKIYTTKDRIGTANATRTGYSLRKHLDPTNDGVQFPGRINYIVFRYAEILLNYAYAMNELNGPVEAVYNAVDRIRVRVDMPKLKRGLNKEEMRDAIKHERRVEFAFEGKHLFDLNSWKTTQQAVEKPTYGKKYNGERFLIETRKFDPNKQYLWAIPLSEIDLSNGVLKQNPGY